MVNPSIIRNGLLLASFALVTTGLIAVTFNSTKDIIAEQLAAKKLATLNEIIAPTLFNNKIHTDCAMVNHPALGGEEKSIYRARMNQQNIALAVEFTATNGYNGNIDLLLGMKTTGELTGVRVLSHKETPGLGDKIDLRISDWILSFNGKTYHVEDQSEWRVKKDGGKFDQFTGATITPRAVVSAVANALSYVNQHQQALFAMPTNCHTHTNEAE